MSKNFLNVSGTETPVQLVYVCCSQHLNYLQTLKASVLISRFVLKPLRITCLTDSVSYEKLTASLQGLFDSVICVATNHTDPLISSRYIKTSMRKHIKGDFLFLDVDAVAVRNDLARLVNCEHMGASPNIDHCNIVPQFPYEVVPRFFKPMNWEYPISPYINSGVLFCRDTAEVHEIFRKWHTCWLEQYTKLGIHNDQPALNHILAQHPKLLTLLPIGFNSPVDVNSSFHKNAIVYHYYLSLADGKPCRTSVLGILSWHLEHKHPITHSLLTNLLNDDLPFVHDYFSLRKAARSFQLRLTFQILQDRIVGKLSRK